MQSLTCLGTKGITYVPHDIYVKLLVHLSKLEAIVHGKLHAMQILQSQQSHA